MNHATLFIVCVVLVLFVGIILPWSDKENL